MATDTFSLGISTISPYTTGAKYYQVQRGHAAALWLDTIWNKHLLLNEWLLLHRALKASTVYEDNRS